MTDQEKKVQEFISLIKELSVKDIETLTLGAEVLKIRRNLELQEQQA